MVAATVTTPITLSNGEALPKTCVGVVGTALVVGDDNGCMLDLLSLFLSFIYLRHPST